MYMYRQKQDLSGKNTFDRPTVDSIFVDLFISPSAKDFSNAPRIGTELLTVCFFQADREAIIQMN